MSFINRSSKQNIVKYNCIEFDRDFSYSYKDFVDDAELEEFRNHFSQPKYYNSILFSIGFAIASPYIESDLSRKFCSLLKNDIVDIYYFTEEKYLPSSYDQLEENKNVHDLGLFDDFDLLKYKLNANKFFSEIPLASEDFVAYMKFPKELWTDTNHIEFAIYDNPNFSLAYLLFLYFTANDSFFLMTDKFGLEFLVSRDKNLHQYIGGFTQIIPLRGAIETLFENKVIQEIEGIREKYQSNVGGFDQLLDDIQQSISIDKAFQDLNFSGKVRQGRPSTMVVEAYTSDNDIKDRSEKLGTHHKIETTIEEGHIQSLKVTKKFKY